MKKSAFHFKKKNTIDDVMHAILTNNGCFYNELHHDDHMVSDLHLKKKQEILLKR